MDRRYLYITLLFSICLTGLHIVGYFFPTALTWGFHFLGFLSPLYFILFLSLAFILILYSLTGKFDHLLQWSSTIFSEKPAAFFSIVVIFFIIATFVFQVKVPLLGDGFVIINNLDNTLRGVHLLGGLYHEPLSMSYLYLFVQLLGVAKFPAVLDAFLLGEIFLGIGFIIITYFIVRNLFDEPRIQMLSFTFLIGTPYMQLFFGYVEIYPVVLFFVALFVLVLVLASKEKIPFYLVLPVFSVLVYAHYLSLMFGIGVVYICYLEYRNHGIKNILIGLAFVLLVTLIVLIAINFDFVRLIPRIPHAHYLSFWETTDSYQAYTLFSGLHLINLFR